MEQKTIFSYVEPATGNCAWNLLKILFSLLVSVFTLIYFSNISKKIASNFLFIFPPSCTIKLLSVSIQLQAAKKKLKSFNFPTKRREKINSNYPFFPSFWLNAEFSWRDALKMLIFCGEKSSINNRMKSEGKVWNFPIIKTELVGNVFLRLFSSLMN